MSYHQLSKKKLKTALKYAMTEGVLIMDSLGEMKSISAESNAGYKRIQEYLEPSSKHYKYIIGFYKVTKTVPEGLVEQYIRDDLIHANLY